MLVWTCSLFSPLHSIHRFPLGWKKRTLTKMEKWILKSSDNPFWKSRPEGNLKHSRVLESLGNAFFFFYMHVTIIRCCKRIPWKDPPGNNGLEASFGNEACNASYLNVIRLLSHHRIPNSGPLFCPNILELFSQVPSWMKDNDQDEDGRLTYKEFKDSVMEAEKAEKHRA